MTGSPSTVLLSRPVISARMRLRELAQILFFALFVRPLMAIFIGYRTQGRQWLPGAGPFVLIANHSSHLDTVSLLNLFPLRRLRDIQPVAAADYFERNRFVAWFSHTFFNILPIDRRRITPGNNPIQRMLAQLRAGKSLIIYPEGARGSGDEIGPIRSGVAHLLEQMPRLPVIPVYLVNHGKCLPKGEWFPVPFFCEIRVGPPQIYSGGNRRESLERLKSALFSLKNAALRPAKFASSRSSGGEPHVAKITPPPERLMITTGTALRDDRRMFSPATAPGNTPDQKTLSPIEFFPADQT
ncbi:MAG TPA: lysophospholipid acyltransferase family protein [Blastocatellia bacterium]|nr:lysophospholipid acyltransferase family protein [Blastocatellia bacterium]